MKALLLVVLLIWCGFFLRIGWEAAGAIGRDIADLLDRLLPKNATPPPPQESGAGADTEEK